MYGSGDVEPSRVDPTTLSLLAELTATYISNLVDAAIESHDILTDGVGGFVPPPPVLEKKRPVVDGRKRKRQGEESEEDEEWDAPLPTPKILNSASLITTATSSSSSSPTPHPSTIPTPPKDWIGVEGIDFFRRSRTRKPYASTPYTLNKESFIFPICHDASLYGRVKEVQAARRMMETVLLDGTVMDMVAEEGIRMWREGEGKILVKRKKVETGVIAHADGDHGEEGEDAVVTDGAGTTNVAHGDGAGGGDGKDKTGEEGGMEMVEQILDLPPGREAKWPGLEHLLPVHRF